MRKFIKENENLLNDIPQSLNSSRKNSQLSGILKKSQFSDVERSKKIEKGKNKKNKERKSNHQFPSLTKIDLV